MARALQRKDINAFTLPRIAKISKRFLSLGYYFSGRTLAFHKSKVNQGRPPWRILKYDRIVNPEDVVYPIPRSIYVKPETFKMHLQFLSRNAHVISFNDLIEKIEKNEPVSEKTVVITIDGGWDDNYTNAAPLLYNYGMPATIFLPTSFIGTENMFWREKVAIALLAIMESEGNIPELLFFDSIYTRIINKLCPGGKLTLDGIGFIISELMNANVDEKAFGIGIILKQATEIMELGTIKCFMDWEQVNQLANANITFGSLGHRHLTFDMLKSNEIELDVRESFETLLERKVPLCKVLSYPEAIVARQSRKVLKKLGINHSVAVGEFDKPNLQKNEATILGRVPMFETASFSPDLFANRLWGVKVMGISF